MVMVIESRIEHTQWGWTEHDFVRLIFETTTWRANQAQLCQGFFSIVGRAVAFFESPSPVSLTCPAWRVSISSSELSGPPNHLQTARYCTYVGGVFKFYVDSRDDEPNLHPSYWRRKVRPPTRLPKPFHRRIQH